MKSKFLILKFKENEQSFYFENKVIVLENKKLIENLKKPNFKNNDSTLLIKSLNETPIYDVIQVKINLNDTGSLLASFSKNSFNEKKKTDLLDKIASLKNKKEPSKPVQTKKIKTSIEIPNKYKPLFVIFDNSGPIKINLSKLAVLELQFPLLVIQSQERKIVLNFKKTRKKPINSNKVKEKQHSPIPLFDMDYFFIFVFSLLGSFGTTTGIFETMNKQAIAVFLFILALGFVLVLIISMQSTIYKKGQERNPLLRYYMIVYILLGIAGGITGGYFVSKGVFKTEIEDFDYKKMLTLSTIISSVSLLSSVFTSMLANVIVQKRNKSKIK